MKKLASFFKFFRKIDGLSIESIFYKDDVLYCKIRDFVSVHPFVIPSVQILTDEVLMEKFRRRDLLRLQEMQSKAPDDSKVKLIESFINQNKYSLTYHGQKFIMTGHDLCKDLKLLESMSTADVCKIVYETAYFTAQQDQIKNSKIEERMNEVPGDLSNVLDLSLKFQGARKSQG